MIYQKKKLKMNIFDIGFLHSELANKIYTKLKGKLVFLPMIYSDELLNHCSFILIRFLKN